MKNVFTIAFMALAMVFSTQAVAQDFSGMDKSPLDNASYPSDYKVSDKVIRITYGRPQLKDRALSELAPAGEVWRTGANEAPEITFYQDVKFGGKSIKAGTYALLTIPSKGEWTVILHSGLNEWGSYTYDESKDVARIKVPRNTDEKSLEEFSITFQKVDTGVNMLMGWAKTRIAVPITL